MLVIITKRISRVDEAPNSRSQTYTVRMIEDPAAVRSKVHSSTMFKNVASQNPHMDHACPKSHPPLNHSSHSINYTEKHPRRTHRDRLNLRKILTPL